MVDKLLKKKNFLRLFLVLSIALLLTPLVFAATKPVAATLMFSGEIEQVEIKLFISINSDLGGEQICTTSNQIFTGEDGSFATNLENLVFKDFPTVSCKSLWKEGDGIWYEINHADKVYISEKEEIKSGTGLQMLKILEITSSLDTTPDDESSAGGGFGGSFSSGGSSSGELILSPEEKEDSVNEGETSIPIYEENSDNILDFYFVDVSVSIEQLLESIKIKSFIKLIEGDPIDIRLQLAISELPSKNLFRTSSESLFLDTNLESAQILTYNDISDGWYQVQTFVYINNQLAGVSSPESFFISNNLIEYTSEEPRLESPYPEFSKNRLYLGLLLLLLLSVFWFLYSTVRTKDTKD